MGSNPPGGAVKKTVVKPFFFCTTAKVTIELHCALLTKGGGQIMLFPKGLKVSFAVLRLKYSCFLCKDLISKFLTRTSRNQKALNAKGAKYTK